MDEVVNITFQFQVKCKCGCITYRDLVLSKADLEGLAQEQAEILYQDYDDMKFNLIDIVAEQ